MKISEAERAKKLEAERKLIEQILQLLLATKEGLTAKQIGEKMKLSDTRVVRELTRAALKEAEKRKLTASRERIPGKAVKIYRVFESGKVNTPKVVEPAKKAP
ncbi:MAG: hypothetical protein A2X94_13585 [Bdellovibrionales bacterium GWB1_55_8]|nr:MAG: hypothetical protein A2X94_13585 [Bdellovibrionales bacterium GWB1_55_8]